MKKPIEAARKQKRKRPNPAGLPFTGELTDMVTGYAGDLAITSAVRRAKCTLTEKLMIAAMVPTLVKIVRSAPAGDNDQLLAALYPLKPGVPKA